MEKENAAILFLMPIMLAFGIILLSQGERAEQEEQAPPEPAVVHTEPPVFEEPAPPPEPTWYQHKIDGEIVYEGPAPVEEAVTGPPPIEKRANQNPTDLELHEISCAWVDVAVEPIQVSDLVTVNELQSAAPYRDLYLVDGRFAVGIKYKGEPTEEARELINQYADTFAQLSNVLNRTQYEFEPAMFERSMSTPTVDEIDRRNRSIRRQLMQEHGVRIGAAILPVSDFTLHNLGR